jgi:hypothetical protein
MSEAIGSILERRKVSIELKRVSTNTKSIELGQQQTQATSITDIPEDIDALIDNKMYRNKFKALIRQGYLSQLQELATMAREKNTPSRWFAVATSKKQWQATLNFLSELRRVRQMAADVLRRIKAPTTSLKAVYKACWRLKDAAIRHAVTAQEIGRDPFRLFCWLCYSSAGTAAGR